MTDMNNSPRKQWTVQRALVLMAVCLMAGIAGGWAVRGARLSEQPGNAKVQSASPAATRSAPSVMQPPSPDQLKAAADSQAAPMIAKLKADPKNLDLLTSIGN